MKSATQQRVQIENLLSSNIPAALTPRRRIEPERIICKIISLDELLGGGLALGALTEFVGYPGSGRTTAALAYVRAVTEAGGVCAWMDAADALDPESAAANGVVLERLLWVRCGPSSQAGSRRASAAQQSAQSPSDLSQCQPRHAGGGSPHPRSEGKDMSEAIRSMLHSQDGPYDKQVRQEKRAIGTPGAPNRPLAYRSEHREEQVNSDRLPPRRGENLAIAARCAESPPRRSATLPANQHLSISQPPSHNLPGPGTSPWKTLDHALRATDLLLQAGGFTVIVLDLANMPPEFAWRIPLATWFRFRAACERTRVSLLLLTQHPCARSSAEAVVRMQPGSMEAQSKVITRTLYRATTERSRTYEARVVPMRKPPQSERMASTPKGQWVSHAAWMETR